MQLCYFSKCPKRQWPNLAATFPTSSASLLLLLPLWVWPLHLLSFRTSTGSSALVKPSICPCQCDSCYPTPSHHTALSLSTLESPELCLCSLSLLGPHHFAFHGWSFSLVQVILWVRCERIHCNASRPSKLRRKTPLGMLTEVHLLSLPVLEE